MSIHHRAIRVTTISAAIVLALVATLSTGCGIVGTTASDEYRGEVDVGYYESPVESPGAPASDGDVAYDESTGAKGDAAGVPQADRMIIRSKTVRLEVESTSEAVDAIRSLARENDAIITGLQVSTDTEGPIYRYDEQGYSIGDGANLRGWITVRVPAATLDAFVEKVSALGTVNYQAEDAEDVTQQHIDLSARLENLRAEEVRLREFFDAATKVEEMLSIERELARVRGDIESLDAQIKYFERQAAMATVTIELTEPKPIVRPDGDTWGFRDAITAGVRGAADVVTFAIAFLIATSPLWLAALLAFFVIRAIVRRRHRARIASDGTAGDATETGSATGDPGA